MITEAMVEAAHSELQRGFFCGKDDLRVALRSAIEAAIKAAQRDDILADLQAELKAEYGRATPRIPQQVVGLLNRSVDEIQRLRNAVAIGRGIR